MPLPLAAAMIPTIISAGAGIVGQGLNAATTSLANNKAYKRAQSMRDYDNTYNSPIEQMKRLKAAGLNPNLVYGNGNSVQASSGKAPAPEAPQFDIQGIVGQAFQAMKLMAETQNVQAMNEQIKIQSQLLNNRNVLQDLQIESQAFKNRNQQSLFDTTLQGLQYKNKLTQAETNYKLDENERRAFLTTQSLTEGANRILQQDLQRAKTQAEIDQIRSQIYILNNDGKIKDWEVGLLKNNVTKNDPLFVKWAADLMEYLKGKARNSEMNKQNLLTPDFKKFINK